MRSARLLPVVSLAIAALAACKTSPAATPGPAGRSGGGRASASAGDDASRADVAGTVGREHQERYFRVDMLIEQWDAMQRDGDDRKAPAVGDQIAAEVDADFDTFAASSRGTHGLRAQHLAIKALGFSKRADATALLVARLSGEDGALVGNALIALKIRSDPATPLAPLVALLRVELPEARRYAPLALANVVLARDRARQTVEETMAERAMTGLVGLAHDRDPIVRLHATKAMGALRRPEATDFLVILLRDEHTRIRIAAAAALERVGDPRTFPQVVRLLEEVPEDERAIVRDILVSFAERIQGAPLAPSQAAAFGTSAIAWDRWYGERGSKTTAPATSRTR